MLIEFSLPLVKDSSGVRLCSNETDNLSACTITWSLTAKPFSTGYVASSTVVSNFEDISRSQPISSSTPFWDLQVSQSTIPPIRRLQPLQLDPYPGHLTVCSWQP